MGSIPCLGSASETLLIERWAKICERWGWDIAQEAAVRVMSQTTQGNLEHPDRYLLVVAKQLALQRYEDHTFDKVYNNHPDFIAPWSFLGKEELDEVWNEMYAADYDFFAELSTQPAPSRTDPLRRALESNLREWRDASRKATDQDGAA